MGNVSNKYLIHNCMTTTTTTKDLAQQVSTTGFWLLLQPPMFSLIGHQILPVMMLTLCHLHQNPLLGGLYYGFNLTSNIECLNTSSFMNLTYEHEKTSSIKWGLIWMSPSGPIIHCNRLLESNEHNHFLLLTLLKIIISSTYLDSFKLVLCGYIVFDVSSKKRV